MKKYCNIVKTEKYLSLMGSEIWKLTHECGEVEERLARRRGDRFTHPAPVRVKCNNAK